MSQNVNELFQNAKDEGMLSQKSINTLSVVDIGAEIQAGLGIAAINVNKSDVVLLAMMPDDSGSIRMAGNAQAMRDGCNLVIDSLCVSKQMDNILALTRYLNGFILNPFVPIDQSVRLDQHNYNPNMGTPLYDQSVILLGTVLAKSQEFSDNGVPVRTISLILSDGADIHSVRADAKMVKAVVDDMLRAENHIVAAMGIDDGHTDFHRVFSAMGIRDEWILTPKNTESEIRKAFNVFSQSAVRASQSAISFSQTAMGGFGN